MRTLLIVLLYLLMAVPPASAGISAAQYTDSGSIRVITDSGKVWMVPDDPSNSHRQMLAEWEMQGNSIMPADPVPLPTRDEKIHHDPDFPKPAEFMEAFIDCRFNSDCTAAQDLRSRLNNLRLKYP